MQLTIIILGAAYIFWTIHSLYYQYKFTKILKKASFSSVIEGYYILKEHESFAKLSTDLILESIVWWKRVTRILVHVVILVAIWLGLRYFISHS